MDFNQIAEVVHVGAVVAAGLSGVACTYWGWRIKDNDVRAGNAMISGLLLILIGATIA